MAEESMLPFLENDPPHWAARGLSYILILLFMTVLLVSAVVRIPETISASFTLIPARGTDPVRAPEGGIVTEVRVREGVSIGKNETLFAIQSRVTGDRSAELRTLQMQSKGAQEKLETARTKYESQRLANEQEEERFSGRLDYVSRMIGLKNKQAELTKELAEKHEKLLQEGVINQSDYVSSQMEADRIALELQQLKTEEKEIQASLRKLNYEAAVQLADYKAQEQSIQEETGGNDIRLSVLENELAFANGDQFSVLAPCAGIVVGLKIKSSGAVVQNGETLCEVVCSGEKLEAELRIPEAGIPRLRNGQGVKLMYDAFPYQRYGVKYGTIQWISPAGIIENEMRIFRVLVDLQHQKGLIPGMGGRAQVVVEKRSLISYAFTPIRQLRAILADPPDRKIR